MELHKGGIYAIIDVLAQSIVGMLSIHKHDAPAIRLFGDIASDPNSMIARHPQDFNLVRLGYITEHNHIHAEYDLIMTGTTWAAAQTPKEN